MPSLACFSESPSGRKDYRFVLANPSCVVDFEHEAVAQATADFSEARRLSDRGYVSVEDFQVIDEGD